MHNFVQHLPDYDLTRGMPQCYRSIAQLLRQLSLSCSQLEIIGKQDVPDNVLALVQEMSASVSSLNEIIHVQCMQVNLQLNLIHFRATQDFNRSVEVERKDALQKQKTRAPAQKQSPVATKKEVGFARSKEEYVEAFDESEHFPSTLALPCSYNKM